MAEKETSEDTKDDGASAAQQQHEQQYKQQQQQGDGRSVTKAIRWARDAWNSTWDNGSKGVTQTETSNAGETTTDDGNTHTHSHGSQDVDDSGRDDVNTMDETILPAEPKAVVESELPDTSKKTDMKRSDLFEKKPYEKEKVRREVEPRVTRAMSKAKGIDLYALWVNKMKVDEASMGPLEFAAYLTEIDQKIQNFNTESGVTDMIECLLSETYDNDEVKVYMNGIISNIPMHDSEAWLDEILCYRISLKEAVSEKDPIKLQMILAALDDEVDNLVTKTKAVIPVDSRKLTTDERRSRIPAHTFLKFKELANGDFERVKARTVAGGNQVDPLTVGETRAPTVGIVSVMSMISLATSVGFNIRMADIEGAFLIPDLKPGAPKRHIYIDRIMTQRYCEKYPEFLKFRDAEQRLTLELRKYLYGLPEAAYEFYVYMRNYLEREGYSSM